MTFSTCVTDLNVLVIKVSNLAYCCHAVCGNLTKLARGKSEESIFAFLSHKLCSVTCSSCKLTAAARIKLNVVNNGTCGDINERQCIARLDIGFGTCHNLVADLEACGSKDVALYAVLILDESDVS